MSQSRRAYQRGAGTAAGALVAAAVGLLCVQACGADTPGEAYRIQAGDILDIALDVGRPFPDAPKRVQVAPDGGFSFPHIGDVPAEGKTRLEVAALMAEGLERLYQHVSVAVNVIQYRTRQVFVWGEVLRPGAVVLDDESMGLAQAIGAAGGVKPTAAGGMLYRLGSPEAPLTVEELQGNLELQLLPDDVVIVEPGAPITVVGEVKNAGALTLPRDARILDVVAAAGNLTSDADGANALLTDRQNQSTRIDLDAALASPTPENNPLARDYAMLIVPARLATAIAGEVNSPGVYVLRADATVTTLVAEAGGLKHCAGPTATAVDGQGQLIEIDLAQAMAAPGSAADISMGGIRSVVIPPESRVIVLMGEVVTPAVVEPEELPIPLSRALGMAGGPSEEADLQNVSILHADGTQEELNLAPSEEDADPAESVRALSFPLVDGDYVNVAKRYARVVVLGAVKRPGTYTFAEGDTAVDAIGYAAGFTPKRARMTRVGLLRRQGDVVEVRELNLGRGLRKGSPELLLGELADRDVVYVPYASKTDWANITRVLFNVSSVYRIFK